jgi:hypothetical protein
MSSSIRCRDESIVLPLQFAAMARIWLLAGSLFGSGFAGPGVPDDLDAAAHNRVALVRIEAALRSVVTQRTCDGVVGSVRL